MKEFVFQEKGQERTNFERLIQLQISGFQRKTSFRLKKSETLKKEKKKKEEMEVSNNSRSMPIFVEQVKRVGAENGVVFGTEDQAKEVAFWSHSLHEPVL